MSKRLISVLAIFFSLILVNAPELGATEPQATTGGRFLLKAHTGQIVTDQDFSGKFMLIYFGYTYCPDICPTSLQTVTAALDQIGDDAKYIQPLFITIDPERDTVAVMREYVSSFHPSLIGLTGSKAVIENVAKKYRVKYAKVLEESADKTDYMVDHTAAVFLMGFDGRYLARFPYNTTANQMAEKLKKYVAQKKQD
jgi:protein SCO1/2